MNDVKRTALAIAFSVALPASAAGLDLGNASLYGIVSAGAGSSLKINSGPIVGDVLVGGGTSVTTSGGNDGQITGLIANDGTVPQTAFNGLQTRPSAGQFSTVSAAYVQSAVASAASVSAYAAALAPNLTFGNISSAQSFSAASGLYVINANNINNADLSFTGTANSFFVVNVSGKYQTNQQITLNGISASQLLFNLTGSSGNVFQTSGGDISFGTYLATNGGDFQFSNLVLTGALINTAGHIEFVSGSSMIATPIPEPSVYAMYVAGLGVLGFLARRRAART